MPSFSLRTYVLTALVLVLIGVLFVLFSRAAGAPVLRVAGDKFVDGSGKTIQLRGVNRPGMEYSCSQGDGFISDPWSAGTGGTHQATSLSYAKTVAAAFLNWDKAGTSDHAINAVRLPLNEECWLGINGTDSTGESAVNPAFMGANYQAFVKALVDELTNNGVYVILDNHWSAPGDQLPGRLKDAKGKWVKEPDPLDPTKLIISKFNGQAVAPNQDHSIAFMTQLATTFKGYSNIMYDIANEPAVQCLAGGTCPSSIVSATGYGGDLARENWAFSLYRDGGAYTNTAGDGYDIPHNTQGKTWNIAGTQQLVNAIRAAGSCSPITVSTIGYGNGYIDMLGSHMPSDPATSACPLGNQLSAGFHAYDYSGFNFGIPTSATALQYDLDNGKTFVAPNSFTTSAAGSITGRYPLYVGEIGTTVCPDASATIPNTTVTGAQWVNNATTYMDNKNYSYTAWGWDSGELGGTNCLGPSLVGPHISTANDTGTTTPYGAAVKAHLQSRQTVGSATPTPIPSPTPTPTKAPTPTPTPSAAPTPTKTPTPTPVSTPTPSATPAPTPTPTPIPTLSAPTYKAPTLQYNWWQGGCSLSTGCKMTIKWTSVNGAAAYDVIKSGTKVATTSDTKYVDQPVFNGGTYTYQIVARNAVTSAASVTRTWTISCFFNFCSVQ